MKTKSRNQRSNTNSPAVSASLIRIGKSRGVRLPKALIEEAGLIEKVELSVNGGSIVIRPKGNGNPRSDWEERFEKSHAKYGPTEAMDPDWEYAPNDFDAKA